MGWLSGLVRGAREEPAGAEQRSLVSADELADLVSDRRTATGLSVTKERALRLAAVAACFRVISEDVAALPWHLNRRLSPRGKERATDHPVYGLLHDLPNPELTSFELRENLVGHVLGWGWGYCEIEFDKAGRRRALWPLRPDRMEQSLNERNERVFVYELPNGQKVGLDRWRVWVIRGWSLDAFAAGSLLDSGRNTIGLGLAAEEYGSRFFGNDSRPGGILTAKGKLSDDAAKRLKARWEESHRGLTSAQRVAVLEEGIEWQQIGVSPENAQFLETRKYQRSEIAGLFRVPPHKIGDLERATFSNIEQQDIEYVNDVLIPMSIRFDQSANRDLLSLTERKTYFAEHFMAGRMRGEQKARYEAYAIGIQNAFLCPDDVREAENMNPLPDDLGQIFLRPLNMAPLGSEPEGDAAATDDTNLTNEGDDDDEAQAD